jgi:para-nitrobenzyl esterase
MLSLWAQFARTGSPGADWPRVSPANAAVELLTPPTPSVATGFAAEHHCSFWKPLLR